MPEQSHQGSRGGRADVTNLVGHVQGNSVGPHRFADPVRMFADPDAGPDEVSFHQPNLDEQYYNSGYYFRHQGEVQPFPRPAPDPAHLSLGQILGPKLLQPILDSRSIALHVVGDSGASTSDLIQGEHRVADAMADDVEAGGSAVPAFLFHLGDVVYNFGEGQYYYDQFYEPYRRYDRPIFAIPGNHDGAVYGPNVDVPVTPTLQAFLRNFCASTPGPSPDAGGLVRTTMTQPGVYFTLDAPWLSIIGLYSNVLESPGVISSQGGHFPLPDDQLAFLASELTRLKPERDAMTRAILLAVHHPPVSIDGVHGSSPIMANEIDAVCSRVGVWPDIVLSGHAHLYQRFTRFLGKRAIPYVVAGSGGRLQRQPSSGVPSAGTKLGNYEIAVDPTFELGYLSLEIDLAGDDRTITGTFHAEADQPTKDRFVLDLAAGTVRST